MRFVALISSLLFAISLGPRGSRVHGFADEGDALPTAPACSVSCLATYVPEYCGSASNLTCICNTPRLTEAVMKCSYAACDTIPEFYQLQRYAAVTCGVKNDKSRRDDVLTLDYVLPSLMIVFLLGRIASRRLLNVGMGADDWTILAAGIAYCVDVGTSFGLVLNDFGVHEYWLSTKQAITGLRWFYVTNLFYMVAITLTKVGLLLCFLRIFPSHRLRQVIIVTGFFIILSNFAIMVALIFQCIPVSAFWTNWMYKTPPTKCIDQYLVLEVAAVFGIIHSVIILVLPVKTVWQLNLPLRHKANLMIMFSVGLLALSCSFMRLPSIIKLDRSSDRSYDQAPLVAYSHIEAGVGIICACLPACRSLLEYFIPCIKLDCGETRASQTTPTGKNDHYHRENRSRSSTRSFARSFGDHKDEPGFGSPWTPSTPSMPSTPSSPQASRIRGGRGMGSVASVEAVAVSKSETARLEARGGPVIHLTRSVEMQSDDGGCHAK
ncbi:hypothetical protein QTJ16_000040 [Diplocarpon rosae]|uniref:Extracellular membrane protein CFEM domain-containing protein n=1 Tax=Diplocarpon rosae TaxID=946125 RepID=A0AAD9WFA8_9HELO|nr:hypothetical protein QTJ16_000040 [Diplocarpon rosae]